MAAGVRGRDADLHAGEQEAQGQPAAAEGHEHQHGDRRGVPRAGAGGEAVEGHVKRRHSVFRQRRIEGREHQAGEHAG